LAFQKDEGCLGGTGPDAAAIWQLGWEGTEIDGRKEHKSRSLLKQRRDLPEEIVEMVGVLVNMVGGRSGDSTGVTTVVEDGACNEVDGTVEETDRDDAECDTDTIAVGVTTR
jgi:hypothetical protein